uniref:methyltransferase-like protein 8 isoform X6 n=1 Tax=Podarcis muralis TaxID=64176 RepID=UPI00109FC05E|nr:methyltransferase-like protein 8 isoform X6 [Podarcis muralis]
MAYSALKVFCCCCCCAEMLFVKRFCASHLKTSKMPHRFQSNKRPVAPLGSRVLLDPDKVFDHNMWDHMQWSQEEEETAKEKAAENSLVRVQPELQAKYEREASRYWNEFYKIHKNHFFKDRKWLFVEFPEIIPEGKSDRCRKAITENLRCTGLLEDNHLCEDNSAPKVSSVLSACYDNSAADEQIVKSTGKQFPGGDSSYRILEVGCGAGNSVFPILEVIRIQGVVNGLARLLKPGGMILFRDYGRYDASQLRFKKGRCLSENFYVRGDGTRAYFFTKDEIHSIFSSAGLTEVQNLLDRRLQVNRKKKVKIHRVWIQGKFQKQGELTQE